MLKICDFKTICYLAFNFDSAVIAQASHF